MIAAGIEGFWSPSSVAPPVKWAVSALNTLLVVGYLAFAGRKKTGTREPEPRKLHEGGDLGVGEAAA